MDYATLWAFWGREVFGWDGFTIGLSLSAYGILIAVVQAGILPQLTRRLGDYRTLWIAMVAALIGFAGFGGEFRAIDDVTAVTREFDITLFLER